MNLQAVLGVLMFLTGGVLVMSLVLFLKANTLYARAIDLLEFAIKALDEENHQEAGQE